MNALGRWSLARPLAPAATAYAAGVLAAHAVALPWLWLLAEAFVTAVLALAWARGRPWLLWAVLGLAGAANQACRTAVLSPVDLRRLVREPAELADVRGRLCEPPVVHVFNDDEGPHPRTVATIETDSLGRRGAWEPCAGRVAVDTPGELPAWAVQGQRVEVRGVLRPPRGAVAEGLFDYRAHLREKGVYYGLRAGSAEDWRPSPGGEPLLGPPWAARFQTWAQRSLARGLPAEDQSLRLLWAMTLGWQTGLTDEVSEPFMQTGTMHIFAISGLHIALIAGMCVAVLRVLQLPRGACGGVTLPLIWAYTAATGWQPSAIRSAIMMSVVIGGWALRRPGDLLNSLAASAFLILLWEPRQLFQASFQLSFFVVLSLALLMPPLTRRLDDWLAPDPLLPAALAPGWRRWLGGPLRHVSLAAATSLAACLGSFPLIAHYFHLVTPVSLAANLVVVPLSSLALMSNLGGLACAPWLPWAAELFNHSAWLWMSWMAAVSEWAARLPGAWFYVRGPGWVGFVLYYAAVGGCFSGWLLAPPRRKWGLAALGLLAVVAAGWAADVGRPTVLTLLAPPSGTCLYADRPGRARDLLIDAGSESAARWVVLPFLQGQGVNRLSHLLVTHGDQAHAGGARLVRDAFRAEAIHTSPIRSTSRGYRYLWEELEQDPGRWQKVQAGDAPAGWQVLHPAARDRWPRGDDNAVVLAATLEGVRVLLLSDLGEAGQEALRGRSPDLRADIVVTGLPRQGEPLRDELLRAVRPALIVVTDAAYPAAERARPALRERLERGGVPVLCLTETGSLTLRFEAGAWEARAMDGRRWRGRPGENGR